MSAIYFPRDGTTLHCMYTFFARLLKYPNVYMWHGSICWNVSAWLPVGCQASRCHLLHIENEGYWNHFNAVSSFAFAKKTETNQFKDQPNIVCSMDKKHGITFLHLSAREQTWSTKTWFCCCGLKGGLSQTGFHRSMIANRYAPHLFGTSCSSHDREKPTFWKTYWGSPRIHQTKSEIQGARAADNWLIVRFFCGFGSCRMSNATSSIATIVYFQIVVAGPTRHPWGVGVLSSWGISQGHAPWPSRENWDGVFEPRALRKMATPHDAATSTIFGAWFAAATRRSGDVFNSKTWTCVIYIAISGSDSGLWFQPPQVLSQTSPFSMVESTVYIEPTASGSGVLERITYSDILDWKILEE